MSYIIPYLIKKLKMYLITKDKYGMSDIFKSYVAGQISFYQISQFLAPNVNS